MCVSDARFDKIRGYRNASIARGEIPNFDREHFWNITHAKLCVICKARDTFAGSGTVVPWFSRYREKGSTLRDRFILYSDSF